MVRATSRRPNSKRRLTLEALENRLVLSSDSVLGAATIAPGPALEAFASAEELERFLVNDALKRYEGMFGQQTWWCGWHYPWLRGGDVWTMDTMAVPEGGQDYSGTNVQVAGVDEGDIVKTDGDYLYILSGGQLVIVDAWPADEMQVASRTWIDGYPIEQYLHGDMLTVISQVQHIYIMNDGGRVAIDALMPSIWPPVPAQPPQVQITQIDVSDRTNPQIAQQTKLDGTLVTSRAIDNYVYVITSGHFGLPGPECTCTTDPQDPDDKPTEDPTISDSDAVVIAPPESEYYPTCTYETRDEYLRRIEGRVLELGLPQFETRGGMLPAIRSGPISDPTDVYKPLAPDQFNLLSITTFDVTGGFGPAASTSLVSDWSSAVYASLSNLYIAQQQWWRWDAENYDTTLIYQLNFASDGGVDPVAIGKVPGRVLNQFSMDEWNGHLRVATTSNRWGRSMNHVFVLGQRDNRLLVVGSIMDLAPGEQIFSARFMGPQGFVVTFRQVDPLFTLDLRNPTQPRVMGELKIPGFSN
jgi:hypothetical protein